MFKEIMENFEIDILRFRGFSSVREYVTTNIDKTYSLASPRGIFYLVELDGVIIGMGALHQISKRTGVIRQMYIKPAYRGKGYGRILLQQLLEKAIEFLNLPRGAVEEGEGVLKAAKREFKEETGFAAERLQWLGRYSPGPNSNVIVDLFFTRDFQQKGEFGRNETMKLEFMDFKALLKRMLSGECFDSALSIAIMSVALKNLV
jgi:8-oxo-dGTP pyrophosphatase MutT (NUDIX family)